MIWRIRWAYQMYLFDRAFGWSRWKSFVRRFTPDPHLLYPPHKNPFTRRNSDIMYP